MWPLLKIILLLHPNTQVQVVWNLCTLQHLLFLLLLTQSSLVTQYMLLAKLYQHCYQMVLLYQVAKHHLLE
ncbi:hypothetical protein P5673_002120 [Acropora cervicornis]|uniref:Uncharacterized protein n=1 Tax=Acropora cervicornis TaxID=6130 RepID=A0AAD9R588_ACRCE|nr:hypothetical protein P5673_002120 [Acropora cervicornis]